VTTVDLQNVSRWYGNVVAVNDITMTLDAGVTGLLGPNGAGKTTMLHMMAGFLSPSRGTVTVDGAPHEDVRFEEDAVVVGLPDSVAARTVAVRS
jgi:ABC-type multidrug transport system ATPase subunit